MFVNDWFANVGGGMPQRPEPGAPRRRQERGERRIAQILDAALAVFADAGYEAATTNAIAAAAGISPGSLYQYFANKEAIAEALAQRFAGQLRAAHDGAFDAGDAAALSLAQLLDRVVDPLVAVNVAHPGFKSLLGTDLPARLAQPVRPLQEAVLGRVEGLITIRAPGLPAEQRRRLATVSVQVFRAMVPLVVAADPAERAALVEELKRVLHGYLAPALGEGPQPRAMDG